MLELFVKFESIAGGGELEVGSDSEGGIGSYFKAGWELLILCVMGMFLLSVVNQLAQQKQRELREAAR